MLHEQGRPQAEVRDYLDTWTLAPREVLDSASSFLTDPLGRTFVVNCTAGEKLCRRYVAGRAEVFRRLFQEEYTPGELGVTPE